MIIQLTTIMLDRLMMRAAKVGAESALVEAGRKPKYISQNEAYRLYKRGQVSKWVSQGWVTPIPGGESKNSRYKYSVVELAIANTKSIYEKSTEHTKP